MMEDKTTELLNTEKDDLFTEDLAAFFIVQSIMLSHIKTVEKVKEHFSFSKDLLLLVDEVLQRMAGLGIISIEGGKISYKQKWLDYGSNPQKLRRFLPKLFRITVKRVIKDAELDSTIQRKRKQQMVRFYIFPDFAETKKELKELDTEYKRRIQEIFLRAMASKDRKPMGMRFVGLVNTIMNPEDFL